MQRRAACRPAADVRAGSSHWTPRERIARTIARETGKSLEAVLADIERDRWLSAEEALECGLLLHRDIA